MLLPAETGNCLLALPVAARFLGLSCNVFVIHQRHGPYIRNFFFSSFFSMFTACPFLSFPCRWPLLWVESAAVLGTRGLKWLDGNAAQLSPKQAFAYGWLNWDPAVWVGWIRMDCKGSLDSDFNFEHLYTLKLRSVPYGTHFDFQYKPRMRIPFFRHISRRWFLIYYWNK